jgi:hypothetical protein
LMPQSGTAGKARVPLQINWPYQTSVVKTQSFTSQGPKLA